MVLNKNYGLMLRDFWKVVRDNFAVVEAWITGAESVAASRIFYSGTTTDEYSKEIFINGISGARLTLGINQAIAFTGLIAGYQLNGMGEYYEIKGLLRRNSLGNVTLTGGNASLIVASGGQPQFTVVVYEDNINKSLVLTVGGYSGITVKWSAYFDIIKIS